MIKATIPNRSVRDVFTILILLLLINGSAYAQKTYTTIKKNLNFTANNFTHELTTTQDSLILESDVPFNKVRFLNGDFKKVFEFSSWVYKSKIPLNELPLGKYTVLFYDESKIIVFRLARLLPFDKSAEEPLEYSIARAASSSYSGFNYIPVNNHATKEDLNRND